MSPQALTGCHLPFIQRAPEQKKMGNCMAGKAAPETVRIMTDAGRIMELEGPVQVKSVLHDFPGYGVFRQGSISTPLQKHDQLSNGELYYLFHLPKGSKETSGEMNAKVCINDERRFEEKADQGKKMSSAGPEVEVLPSPGKGVWKVKMVIGREQLAEILAEQGNTEALIERMRVAASQGGPSSPRLAGKGGWAGGWRPNLSSACKPCQDDYK